MAYLTNNELEHFDFSQSSVIEIKRTQDYFVVHCSDVIIPLSNSCNEDVEKMGAEEVAVRFRNPNMVTAKKDGYKIYNLDDTLREEIPEEEIEPEAMKKFLKDMEGNPLFGIEKKENLYYIYIDTDEMETSYTISLEAEGDEESWEFHHRLPAHLR